MSAASLLADNQRIDVSKLQKLNVTLKPIHVSELPEDDEDAMEA